MQEQLSSLKTYLMDSQNKYRRISYSTDWLAVPRRNATLSIETIVLD